MATTAWRDLALDSSGDLILDGGDLALVQGEDAIAQECRVALALWVGEFPFDVTVGTDWPTLLNNKGLTDSQIAAEVRRVLLTVDGVQAVDNVSVERDTVSRAATIAVDVRTDTGAVLTIPTVTLGLGV